MAESRESEREELTARARHALEHAETQAPGDYHTRCRSLVRVWRSPSLGLWQSWTVFFLDVPGANEHDVVLRSVIWDAPHDLHRLSDPMAGLREGFHTIPAIAVRDTRLPLSRLQPFLDALALVPLPAAGFESIIGLDGEFFGYEAAVGFNNLRVEWWEDGPQEWRAFTDGVKRLCAEMERCMQLAEAQDGR